MNVLNEMPGGRTTSRWGQGRTPNVSWHEVAMKFAYLNTPSIVKLVTMEMVRIHLRRFGRSSRDNHLATEKSTKIVMSSKPSVMNRSCRRWGQEPLRLRQTGRASCRER